MIATPGRLALGYLRRFPLMSALELGALQQRMATTASARRLVLGTVHVEELPTQPQAFAELLTSVRALDVAAVIVPTLIHIGDRDAPGTLWNQLWLAARVEVVFTGPSP